MAKINPINYYGLRSGRVLREDGSYVNETDLLNLPVQGVYGGSGNATISLDNKMTGFAIVNRGTAPLTFHIGWVSVVVAAGESFEDIFEPYDSLQVDATGAWSACVKGAKSSQSRWFDGVVPEIAATFRSGVSSGYKGTSFVVKTPATLEAVARKTVGASPVAENYQVWRLTDDYMFDVQLAAGSFGTQRDGEGYISAQLSDPIALDVGGIYIVIFHHTNSANGFWFESSLGIVSRNPVFDYTSDMAYNYNSSTAPAPGIAMGGGAGAYDFRFKMRKRVV